MKKSLPPKVYKYGSFQNSEYLREILLEDKLYCCSPLDFNDPFDCRPKVVIGRTRAEMIETKKVIEKVLLERRNYNREERRRESRLILQRIIDHGDLTETYNLLLSRKGVYCLTTKNDNLLMWAHYGDKHRGYCLEFSTEPENSFFSGAQPVGYEIEYPTIKLFNLREVDYGKEAFLTKSVDWEYEDEWRLTSVKTGHINFPPEKLLSIILGCKVSETHVEQVIEWNKMRKLPVILRKAVMHEEEFKLKIIEEGNYETISRGN